MSINILNLNNSDLNILNQSNNSIKYDKIDYKNQVCAKPWGYEYLCYESNKIGIWQLRIINNNKTAKDYENATFSVFKKIDNNIKRVVAPRNQIDEILKQLPNINTEVNTQTIPVKNLNFLVSMGNKYPESVNLEIEKK